MDETLTCTHILGRVCNKNNLSKLLLFVCLFIFMLGLLRNNSRKNVNTYEATPPYYVCLQPSWGKSQNFKAIATKIGMTDILEKGGLEAFFSRGVTRQVIAMKQWEILTSRLEWNAGCRLLLKRLSGCCNNVPSPLIQFGRETRAHQKNDSHPKFSIKWFSQLSQRVFGWNTIRTRDLSDPSRDKRWIKPYVVLTDLCLLLYAAVGWCDEEDQTMLQMIITK